MIVYEISTNISLDVLWIATDHKVRLITPEGEKSYLTIKAIPEYNESTPGVDIIIE